MKGPTKYMVYGTVCSVQCGVAFIDSEADDLYAKEQRKALFLCMCTSVHGMPRDGVVEAAATPAPSRFALTTYGGPLTLEQFRNNCLKATSRLISPPFLPFPIVLEQHARRKARRQAKKGAMPPVPPAVMRLPELACLQVAHTLCVG